MIKVLQYEESDEFYEKFAELLQTEDEIRIETNFTSYSELPTKFKEVFKIKEDDNYISSDLFEAGVTSEKEIDYFDRGLGGFAVGAAVGSIIPGIGTVVGGLMGGFFGLGSGLLEDPNISSITIEISPLGKMSIKVKKDSNK